MKKIPIEQATIKQLAAALEARLDVQGDESIELLRETCKLLGIKEVRA